MIDNSFSMRAGTRLADAKREALSVLSSRRPSDKAQVMSLGSQMQVLTQPTLDAGALRAAVDSVQPGDSRASYGELARAVRSLADSSVHTPIELHFFSDMQKVGDAREVFRSWRFLANVTLVLHPVAKASRAELDRGERQRAGTGLGSEEGARAGRHRRIRHSGGRRARFRWS